MMDDNQFWARIWGYAAACLIALIVTIALYNAHRNEVVAKSTMPLELACAIAGGNYSHTDACVTLAVRGK